MNGYDLYCTYQAIKLHFESDKYNFFIYGGKTKTSVDSFDKRKDKYLFHRLARKYNDEEIIPFLVANFVHSNSTWTRSLLENEAEDVYMEWKRVTDSMTRVYLSDLAKLCPDPKKFNDLFKVEGGGYPKLLTALMQKEITIETVVILNNIFDFIKIWDAKISDDIVYPKLSRKVRKYGAFLTVSTDKYKALTKKFLLGEEPI